MSIHVKKNVNINITFRSLGIMKRNKMLLACSVKLTDFYQFRISFFFLIFYHVCFKNFVTPKIHIILAPLKLTITPVIEVLHNDKFKKKKAQHYILELMNSPLT